MPARAFFGDPSPLQYTGAVMETAVSPPAASTRSVPPMRWWEWAFLLVGLTAFAAQAALASPMKSAAFDEEYHIAAGYAYLKTADFRMSASHPPLVNLLSAVPLLWLDDIQLPTDHPAWAAADYFQFSDQFLWQANDNPQQILVYGRLPIIILGTVLAAALFGWARAMAGPMAGWIALALAVFDPNLLANARLVTTDLGLTLFISLTMWRLWLWRERPSPYNLVWVGVMAGLSMAAKFTGLMVWPMIALTLILDGGDGKRFSISRFLTNLFLMGLIAYLTLWAVFHFDFGPIPQSDFPLPVPAPYYPYSVWDTFMVIEEQPKAAFLLGQISDRGWWYYFPIALALKTPLPLLALTAVGLFILLRQKRWRETAVLWVPPLLFMGLAMTGRIAIGYRHILPVVPFLIMLAAQTGRRLKIKDWGVGGQPFRLLLTGTIILLAWQIGGVLRLFPHQEAFFNEIAGGPANGSRHLVDANIDWGQDLLFLKALLAEMGIDEPYLAYFGTALPEKYGINYKPLPGFMRFTAGKEINAYNPYTPPPGWYAVSETSRRLGLMLQNTDMYAYFHDKEPVACAGYSICLYHVEYPAEMPVDRTVVYGRSVSDIPAAELGVQDGRRQIVKWSARPEAVIYPLGEGFVPPDDFQPFDADFGAFRLLGFVADTAVVAADSAHLTLYWQVETAVVNTPAPSQAAPLAAFVHLSGADPASIIAQHDGWPTALSGLESGDIIRQPIVLQLPPDVASSDVASPDVASPDAFWRVGLYSPQTGQRLPAKTAAETIDFAETADFVALSSIKITP
ncbi:MAG: phospholipid carrier-dependent glycosyltransferase [Chloroflexi bacterium]|nr:phospholipid carrier-dependent glycosyltransferase [Chloroflexota bacterium]